MGPIRRAAGGRAAAFRPASGEIFAEPEPLGQPFRGILESIPGTTVEPIEQCSAFDGTWGMKAQHYEMGRRYAQKLVRAVNDAVLEGFLAGRDDARVISMQLPAGQAAAVGWQILPGDGDLDGMYYAVLERA